MSEQQFSGQSDIYVCEVSARETYTVRVRARSGAEARRKAREFDAAWGENPEAVYNWGTRTAVRVHDVQVEEDEEVVWLELESSGRS